GGPQDAVEKVLLDQLLAAHLKVGELYALAAKAKQLDYMATYGNAAARLLGAICQLVTTLSTYRTSSAGRGRPPGARGPGASPARAGGPSADTQKASSDEEGGQ